MRYTRNRIYISDEQQQRLMEYRVFIGGCGIGSVIAECMLRMGFENITIADGDSVELSNLNRQNYLCEDIGRSKTESLRKRLLQINPTANIGTCNMFLTEDNIAAAIGNHHAAINALDFQSNAPFVFDKLCQQKNIPVLHPYNIGWAALLFVITPGSPGLTHISRKSAGFEKEAVHFFLKQMEPESLQRKWVEGLLNRYSNEKEKISPPQLATGSWLLGGLCSTVLYRLANNLEIKSFPDFYFLSSI